MRITTRMGPHKVVVLVDRGLAHNFISDRLANLLTLPFIPMEAFSIRVANGETLKCQERYDKVRVEFQGTEFYLTLFSLPLTSLDLVLGVQWLQMFGFMVCDWKQLTMNFIWDNPNRRLQGVDVQAIQVASPNKLSKELRQAHALFAVCFQPTLGTTSHGAPPNDQKQDMQRLLKDYADVFQEPSSLPLVREAEHCITLKTESINVRLY
ncbi:unnamed protein product [Ilex paraguariensis]|uniref:RVP_2 domain-containing protein n=1 Tax=Ilex paraguariensis TaxID=185542 RepID=A0ABC8R839_9AQUA